MITHLQRESKKRGKYGRPCDRCAARRIRCVTSSDSTSCTGCLNLGEKCTRDRIRKKSGPKHGRRSSCVAEPAQELNESIFAGPGPKLAEFETYPHAALQQDSHILGIKREESLGESIAEIPQIYQLNTEECQGDRNPLGFFDSRIWGYQQSTNPDNDKTLNLSNLLPSQHQEILAYQAFAPGLSPVTSGMATSPIVSQLTRSLTNIYPIHYLGPATGHYMGNSPQPMHILEVALVRVQDQTQHSSLYNHGHIQDGEPLGRIKMPDEHEDIFSVFKTNSSVHMGKISLECLFLQVQVYQTWFYGYWPVLSVTELMQKIQGDLEVSFPCDRISLNDKNAMSYALCCAICAAITTQLSFVSQETPILNQNSISAEDYAAEAKRVRNLFEYTDNINVETLLSSFFLYLHHTNQKGRIHQAKMYLREAISLAQILGFHEKNQYRQKSTVEAHRWRKIYYMLLVTERYVCFEEGLPVILDPGISFPELSDEDCPDLLVGFSELIRIFSVPSKEFFFEMNQHRLENFVDDRPLDEKRQWILAVQESLGSLRLLPHGVSNPHRLNITLSKAWIRAIACHITWKNGMLRPLQNPRDCFGFDFPIFNAREFLLETSYLPDMAFETNGPGICVKLLEMAKSLSFTVQQSLEQMLGLTALESLFGLVNKFKNDVTLPTKAYEGIANLIARYKIKVVPRLLETNDTRFATQEYQSGTIEELLDDDVTGSVENQCKLQFSEADISPYSRHVSDEVSGLLTSVANFLTMLYPHIENSSTGEGS